MSDPLSISASLIAVLHLAATATQYLKDVRSGSAQRTRLRDELRNSVCLLEMIRDRVEDLECSEVDAVFKPASLAFLQGPEGPVKIFQVTIQEIVAKLAPQDRLRRLAKPFTWPFDKHEVAELLGKMERLKSHFNLFIQDDIL